MSLKPVFLYPRYSFLSLGYRFMISKISSMDNPVVREAAFTNRQYFLGASTLIIFMPFLINSGVPEIGLAFISAQAQFRTAINGRVSLTLGPSIFLSLVAMGTTSIGCGVRLVLLCSFAAGFNRERVELSTRNLSKLSCPVFRDEIRPLAYSSFGDAKGQSRFNCSAKKTDNIRFSSGHLSWCHI